MLKSRHVDTDAPLLFLWNTIGRSQLSFLRPPLTDYDRLFDKVFGFHRDHRSDIAQLLVDKDHRSRSLPVNRDLRWSTLARKFSF
jgi:hypothetical protein